MTTGGTSTDINAKLGEGGWGSRRTGVGELRE